MKKHIIIIITIMLSHLCRVFTIVHLKPTMFLGYTALQIFSSYSLWYMYAVSHVNCFVLPHHHFLKCVCSAQYVRVCVFSSLISCFPGMLLRYYLNDLEMVPVVSLVTLSLLLLPSTCAEFLLWSLYILECSQLLSLPHFSPLKFQRLLIYIFFFHYHGL